MLRQIHHYIEGLFSPEDPLLLQARPEELHQIQVPPMVGKLLYLLARIQGAHRILEVGTLGGYSATWLGRALPKEGELISLELEPQRAEIARQNLAALSCNVQVLEGDAVELLPTLSGPFDLVFLDADKERNRDYLEAALPLCRSGTLIIIDNLLRRGKVLYPRDPQMQAIAEFNVYLSQHARLEALILPVFGGYEGGNIDGVGIARVR